MRTHLAFVVVRCYANTLHSPVRTNPTKLQNTQKTHTTVLGVIFDIPCKRFYHWMRGEPSRLRTPDVVRVVSRVVVGCTSCQIEPGKIKMYERLARRNKSPLVCGVSARSCLPGTSGDAPDGKARLTLDDLRKEMFYLTTHSPHFIYGYMASDIW